MAKPVEVRAVCHTGVEVFLPFHPWALRPTPRVQVKLLNAGFSIMNIPIDVLPFVPSPLDVILPGTFKAHLKQRRKKCLNAVAGADLPQVPNARHAHEIWASQGLSAASLSCSNGINALQTVDQVTLVQHRLAKLTILFPSCRLLSALSCTPVPEFFLSI